MINRFTMKQYLLVSLLVLFGTMFGLVSKSEAGLIHSLTPDQEYLEFGESLDFVGYLETDSGSGFNFNGSVSLVDIGDGRIGHWALGAAHTTFLSGNARGASFDSFRIGFSNNFNSPSETYIADRVFVHPDYSSLASGSDLALFYFDSPVANIEPVKIYNGDATTLIGEEAYFAGYGNTGNNLIGFTGVDGNKRAGINRIDAVDTNLDHITSLFRPFGSFGSNPLGILSGVGDSGGFYGRNNAGILELIGANSLAAGDSYFGVGSASIYDPIWGNDVAGSISTVPEPGTFFTTGLGCAWIASRRRKRKKKS